MNSKNIIFALMLVSMSTPKLAMAATQPSNVVIKKAKSMYNTFKNDMKCFFDPRKKCHWTQKRRIKREALALVTIIISLGATFKILSWKKQRELQLDKKEAEKEAQRQYHALLDQTETITISPKTLPISRASYYVDEYPQRIIYYTYDGIPLKKVKYSTSHYREPSKMIDPDAPKPQPVRYKIEKGTIRTGGIYLGSWPKKVPQDFIVFYDKNGNKIDRYRYDKTNKQIEVWTGWEYKPYLFGKPHKDLQELADFPLDLSALTD